MKRLLIIGLLLTFQLNFASPEKKINFVKAQQNISNFCVGALMANSGVFMLCYAASEFKKYPENSTLPVVHGVGTILVLIGGGVMGYSVAMSKQHKDTQGVLK